MINEERLSEILVQYKEDFSAKQWNAERYKWVAVKHFQDHWDINADDFHSMLVKSLAKTENLLASMANFPRKMISDYAKSDPERVRGMFIALFDESQDLYARIAGFKEASASVHDAHGEGHAQHFQHENAITTYLWLRFPDKYYIYKFGEAKKIAETLESNHQFKSGAYADNIRNHFELYNEIAGHIALDTELVTLLRSHVDSQCYSDLQLRTLTVDVGFYISRQISMPPANTSLNKWFPQLDEYHPGLDVDDWESLLQNPKVFTDSSLEIMKRFKDIGGESSCINLAETYGRSSGFYNGGSSSLAERVSKETGCRTMPRDSESSRWWPILFTGRRATAQERGSYIWRLRDELSEALERVNLNNVALYSENNGETMTSSTVEQTQPDLMVEADEPAEPYTSEEFLAEVFMTEERYTQLVGLLRNKKNVILQGAPGVGKTFAAQRLAWSMMGEKDLNRIEFVQFHQNYSYEDFMMGYRPSGDGFELKHGVFYNFCKRAEAQPDQEFFFIIDEINRGNLSKIFGELLMLIERDYRGTSATLAYSGQRFSVPPNLYLIGMMNTADRSLAMIDYALRRRFSFVEIEPGFDTPGFTQYRDAFADDTFSELIGRIKDLNVEITQDRALGKGFCIGHSYVCGREEVSDEWIRDVIEYDILPMLGEYWFDDLPKLQRWENNLRAVLQR